MTFRLVAPCLLLFAAGCLKLDIPDGAQLSCESDDDCPADFRCEDALARCVRRGAADVDGPVVDDIAVFVDGVAVTPQAVAGAGATLAWSFQARDPGGLFGGDVSNPQVTLATRTANAFAPTLSVDGDTFRFELVVSERDGVFDFAPTVVVVDNSGNVTRAALPVLAADTVAPTDVVVTVEPDDVAPAGAAFVTASATDTSALSACMIAVDDGDPAPACAAADFGALAQNVSLPGDNGRKQIFVRVRDAAGNEAEAAPVRILAVDGGVVTARPALTLPAGQTRIKPGDTVAVAVDVTAGASVDRARLLVDGVARALDLTFVAAGPAAFASTLVVPDDVDDGDVVAVEVTAALFGLTSIAADSRSAGVVVDRVAPVVSATAPLDLVRIDPQVTALPVACSEAATLTVTGDVEAPLTVSCDDPVSFTLSSTQPGGGASRTVSLVAVDDAGNASAPLSIAFVLVGGVADGAPTLSNRGRPGVPGVRGTDEISIGGVVDNGATVSAAALVFFDVDGAELCRVPTSAVRANGDVFTGTVIAGAAPCGALGPATTVQLSLSVAFVGGLARSVTSNALYLDDDAPADVDVGIVPVGVERNNATARPTVSLRLVARDAHPVVANLVGGGLNVAGNLLNVVVDGRDVDVTFDVASGVSRDVVVNATFVDEVGNSATVARVFRVDRTPPLSPSASGARMVRAPVDESDPLGTDEQLTRLDLTSLVVDAVDRVVVRAADGADLSAPLDVDAGVVAVPLPAGSDTFALVALDDAGNESPALALTVPSLRFVDMPARPFGSRALSFVVDGAALGVANLVDHLQVGVGADVADCVRTNAASVDCALAVTDPAVPEGFVDLDSVGAAVIVATLDTPGALVRYAAPLLVDLTAPILADAPTLRVDSVAGSVDRVVGGAGAIVDFAGASALTARFAPQVRATYRGVTSSDVIVAADGSFVVALGDVTDSAGVDDVVLVVTDVAGNTATRTLQNDATPPQLTLTPFRARVRPGEAIAITVRVVDAGATATPTVTIGGVGVAVVDVPPVGDGVFQAQAVAGSDGTVAVAGAVVDAAGNRGAAATSVVVDGTPPTVTPQQNAHFRGDRLSARVVDAAGLAAVALEVREDGAVIFGPALATAVGDVFQTPPGLTFVEGRSYALAVTATDTVGNVAAPTPTTHVFDLTPPVVTLTVDTSDPHRVPVPFTIDTSDSVDDDGVACALDGGSLGPCAAFLGFQASPRAIAVAPGTHTLFVRATDTAGNVGAIVSETFTVRARQRLAAGDGVFCAIDDVDSRLVCWGDQRGEVDAAAVGPVGPTEIVPAPGEAFREVAVHKGTICTLDDRGLACWGDNANGRARRPTSEATVPLSFSQFPLFGALRDLVLFDTGGCVVNDDDGGALACWGQQLLNETIVDEFPQQVFAPPPGTSIVEVQADGALVCLRLSDDTATCIGDNRQAQAVTGVASLTNAGSATFLVPAVQAVRTSGRHTCALDPFGAVFCTGDDTTGAIRGVDDAPSPLSLIGDPLPGPFALEVIAAGPRTCLLGVDGLVRCHGQLAFEVDAPSRNARPGVRGAEPVALALPPLSTFIADDHTVCGVARADGAVVCVGENGRGQIDLAPQGAPAVGLPIAATHIVAGGHTVCVGTGDPLFGDGPRLCVGDNADNRWLIGTEERPTSDVFTFASNTRFAPDVRSVFALGNDYGCGVDVHSNLIACAGAAAAPLGRATAAPAQLNVAFHNGGIPVVIDVADAYGCAVVDDVFNDSVRCWGDVPTGPATITPVALGGDLSDTTALGLGEDHLCVLVASSFTGAPAEVRCLGDNTQGQLGRPGLRSETLVTILDDAEPAAGSIEVHRLAAAGATTCVASSTGPLCWGDNRVGQAGQPAGDVVATPQAVAGVAGACTAVGVGVDRACAAVDGALICWGQDEGVVELDDDSYVDVAVSDAGFVCGLTSDNRARCFGDVRFGLSLTGDGFRAEATEVVLP